MKEREKENDLQRQKRNKIIWSDKKLYMNPSSIVQSSKSTNNPNAY